MPSIDALALSKSFSFAVSRLDSSRARAEACLRKGTLRRTDLDVLYRGLFLQLIIAYEATIEDFVLGLTVRPGGVYSSVRGVKGAFVLRTYAHSRKLVSGRNKDYADWIAPEHLLHGSSMLLMSGRPFSMCTQADWDIIRKAKYIRNAIAHPSDSAKKKFEKHVVGSTPLPAYEKKVHGYLRGAAAPPQTRWELYAANLAAFVSKYVR